MEHKRSVTVPNVQGLHARPCHAMVSAAMGFRADVRVSCSGRSVNGKSILELMTLSAAQGDELVIEAAGEDAERAVDALTDLVRGGFGE